MDSYQLTDLETDLLKEVFNIGISHAGNSLSLLMKQEVALSVPEVSFLSPVNLKEQFLPYDDVCCVRQVSEGLYKFNSNIFFPSESTLQLVQLMLGEDLDDDILFELRPEAMTEIGNIIINTFIGSINKFLDLKSTMSMPEYFITSADNFVNRCGHGGKIETVLSIKMDMLLKENEVEGQLWFIFDSESFDTFYGTLKSFLAQI